MQIKNQNNLGFSAVTLDTKKLAKLGPEFAKELKAALPEIEKRSGGVDVLLTTKVYNTKDHQVTCLNIISKTKKSFGGFLGIGAKKGTIDCNYGLFKDVLTLKTDKIVKLVANSMQYARAHLRLRFEAIHGTPADRTPAREARKALNILKGISKPQA